MPMPSTGPDSPAIRRPSSTSRRIRSMSQRSDPSWDRTPPLGKRCTSSSSRTSGSTPTRATITRPEVAPRSTATIRLGSVMARPSSQAGSPEPASSQEGRRDPRVDGDVQPGGVRQVRTAQYEDRVGAVLGKHLALEQGALGVELAQVLLLHAIDLGPLGPQPPAKMPEPWTPPSGLTPV